MFGVAWDYRSASEAPRHLVELPPTASAAAQLALFVKADAILDDRYSSLQSRLVAAFVLDDDGERLVATSARHVPNHGFHLPVLAFQGQHVKWVSAWRATLSCCADLGSWGADL